MRERPILFTAISLVPTRVPGAQYGLSKYLPDELIKKGIVLLPVPSS